MHLKKIPHETISTHRLRLKLKCLPSKELSRNEPDYENCSLIAKIYNTANKLKSIKMRKEELILHQTAKIFFEFLNQPEKSTMDKIKELSKNLINSAKILDKRNFKRKNKL
ncbi:MAG: hypothetical protein UR27_C0009G0006 [Candidatus Peregrinibacteria bacterium GW2011_GWA2_33_10]|nr:MAG: hypothetical protein UR27_C0009G0006 [Candidatus Peregrinibacteria bacterium GW2011_GWA2_33_10]KKP41271.1 MAG: hypothetical protein UR30_C0001G0118 [Candidatus Peregrinibacteria bacterium GW2011_GWC2_33_13]OGJ48975.1 MAG: hypothetical protein A2229_00890 [Candidatus Peregrinibacteria bacterium RIFOXYA2_FULL_33_7]